MRDGVVLRADVYRPDGGEPVPAVLSRTPYDRSLAMTPPAALDPERAVEAGFALVCQDIRGRHGSEGRFYPFRSEPHDGYDSVEWVAAQPWCDGSVGMAGRSYAAAAQWLAAAARPPGLRAIAPVVIGSDYYNGWVYQGGAFQLGFNLFWVSLMARGKPKPSLERQFRHLPLDEAPLLDQTEAGRFYRDWLAHPTDDEYWRPLKIRRHYPQVEVPALNVGGWYDLFLTGTLENFAGLRRGSEGARGGTRLIVGPWAHGSTYGTYPDHSFDVFGDAAQIDLDGVEIDFFGRHLRGEPDGDEPPVRIFVMGENRWRDEDDWPLARAREERWYLRADGGLSPEPPGDERPDEYVYDPDDPAPTIGGPTSLPAKFMATNSGPLDQRPLESRPDVLVFSSEPLTEPLEVTGPVTLALHAATAADDADWIGKLCDVDPDGASRILAEGVLRARYREGFDRARPLEPGRPYDYSVELGATCNVFLTGHRVRLLVTSSSFPRFDRNPAAGDPVQQAVFHDKGRPSHLRLPVVRR
jgi:putative CocE/NonD family hydrolase